MLKHLPFSWRYFVGKDRHKIKKLCQNPILIGGCGRSGTTLMLSILSSIPHIYCVEQETYAFAPLNKNWEDLRGRVRLDTLFRELSHCNNFESFNRFCEKTPRNILFIERILNLMGPNTRIIHMVRDGRDVVASIHPLAPDRYWVEPRRWVYDLSKAKQFDQHPQVLVVFYEKLVTDYENTIRRICSFLAEPFHENLLKYPNQATILQNSACF